MRYMLMLVLTLMGLFAIVVEPSYAQATRTWVSGVGDDANPCSRTAPCKTFAGAISKTAAGGEISVLDPGGFGAVTIVKSISIVADGSEGSILAAGTTGIIINAGVNDVVSIRGLIIEGANSGIAGIKVLQAKNVYVSKTAIRGFNASTGRAVDVSPTSAAVRVFLQNVEINNSIVGVYGHMAAAGGSIFLSSCTIEGNSANAVLTDTGTSIVKVSNTVFGGSAVTSSNGAQVISTGNNVFGGGGAPTSTTPLQ